MRDAATLAGMTELNADVVVVGAGAGGAACAAEMAGRGLKVVLLEDGHRYEPRSFKANYGWALNHIYADHGARVVEAESLYPMPAGRGVGGSTLINSAICYRAPSRVLSHWANDLGLHDLEEEKLRPLYEYIESTIGVVEMDPSQARANNLFIKRGAERLGLEGAFIHRNAPGCVGCGVCHLGCPSGGKGSVDRNFIPLAEEHGAEVCADSKAERILLANGRAVGVEAAVTDIETDRRVGTLRVRASRVVLACGSIGTPLLLLKQQVANHSGQVGRNLAIHPAVGAFGFVADAINSWDGVPQAYAVFLDREEGILLQAYNANPEVFFASLPWTGGDGLKRMHRMKNLAMCGGFASDRPSGSVSIGRHGKARVSYALGDLERIKLIRALRGITRILFAAGATEVYPGTGDLMRWTTSEAEALAVLRDDLPERALQVYASHPMGTCRMGLDPKTSVVDASGESHDVKGLYIADASVMPTSLGVNPQLTVMALGIIVGRSVAKG